MFDSGSLFLLGDGLLRSRFLTGHGRLESGTGRKSRYRGCCDLEFLARLRVAACARGTLGRLEAPPRKASELGGFSVLAQGLPANTRKPEGSTKFNKY